MDKRRASLLQNLKTACHKAKEKVSCNEKDKGKDKDGGAIEE